MPLPQRLARFNKVVTNRVDPSRAAVPPPVRPILGWIHGDEFLLVDSSSASTATG